MEYCIYHDQERRNLVPLSLKKGATVFAVNLKILRLINRVNSVL